MRASARELPVPYLTPLVWRDRGANPRSTKSKKLENEHWRQGIFIIVRVFQESLLCQNAGGSLFRLFVEPHYRTA